MGCKSKQLQSHFQPAAACPHGWRPGSVRLGSMRPPPVCSPSAVLSSSWEKRPSSSSESSSSSPAPPAAQGPAASLSTISTLLTFQPLVERTIWADIHLKAHPSYMFFLLFLPSVNELAKTSSCCSRLHVSCAGGMYLNVSPWGVSPEIPVFFPPHKYNLCFCQTFICPGWPLLYLRVV